MNVGTIREAQKPRGRYLPIGHKLDLPGKSKAHGTYPSAPLIDSRVALESEASLQFSDGKTDGAKAGPNVHTPSIYPGMGKSTPERVTSAFISPAQNIGMAWNLENFSNALRRYTEQEGITDEQFAKMIGIGRQSLANILNGQKALGARRRPRAAEILGWPNPDFSDPVFPHVNESLLQTIIICVEEEYGTRLNNQSRALLITRVYNLALVSPALSSFPSKDKILGLVRSLGA